VYSAGRGPTASNSRTSSVSDVLALAERVASRTWAISVPRPLGGDAAVLYVLEVDDELVLVDAGWNAESSFARLSEGLRQAGLDVAAISGVLLTHLHPDHCGLAARVRELTGAWIAAHPREVEAARYRHGASARFLTDLADWLPLAGVPAADSEELLAARQSLGDDAPVLEIDVSLDDHSTIELCDRTLESVLTPGHSPGHLCFHDAEHATLFAGDVVLPKRLPPIGSFTFDGAGDPVATFFASLDRVSELDGSLVLPGHGKPFVGPRADADRIRQHHERRMSRLAELLQQGPATVWQAALQTPWTRPWGELPRFAQLLGLGKVNAHLTALTNRGVVRRHDGDPMVFALAGQAA